MSDKVIYGRHYVTQKAIAVHICGQIIEKIEYIDDDKRDPGLFIAPGLVDLQVNGYHGVDFSSLDITVEEVVKLTRNLWQTGVTSFFPTIISSAPDVYRHTLTVLRDAISHPDIRGAITGIHMEGPFLSTLYGYRGAHDLKWIKIPDWNEFHKFCLISGNQISLVTLAPELPGAPDFIAKCIENGISVAIGHHSAKNEQINTAVEQGAVLSTHLGNACANLINRHDNILWPQLADDRLYASIIMDGFHLNRDEAIVFFRAKGPDKIILISDITKFAGLSPGEYKWHDTKVTVSENGKIYQSNQDILAGAGKALSDGITNLTNFTGCTMAQAINAAGVNPAHLMQLNDRGELVPGKRADIIILRILGPELEVVQTLVAGETVFDR